MKKDQGKDPDTKAVQTSKEVKKSEAPKEEVKKVGRSGKCGPAVLSS